MRLGRSGLIAIATFTGLGAISILIGWFFSNFYFQEIGAPWASQVLSVQTLMKLGAQSMPWVLIGALYGIDLVLVKKRHRSIQLRSTVVIGLGFGLLFVPKYREAAGAIVSIGVGLTFAEYVAVRIYVARRIYRYDFQILLGSTLFVVFYAMSSVARGRADEMRTLFGDEAPLLEMRESIGSSGSKYHLLANGEAGPIVFISSDVKSFGVYEWKDILTIRSISRKPTVSVSASGASS